MNLLQRFSYNLGSTNLHKDHRTLLAVSGGVDSMVLLELFRISGRSFIVAHCNFKLRGEDADADADFVRLHCQQHQIPFFSKSFDTAVFAKDNGISIQMAARKLRYDWFNQLMQEQQCHFLATAHHADDTTETVLLNLVKGTGMAGMHGIRLQSSHQIRPLFDVYRSDILHYANQNGIEWRDDASNADSKYERNFIRNEVLPMLKSINPSVSESINRHSRAMERYETLLNHFIHEVTLTAARLFHNGLMTSFDLTVINSHPEPATLLFHILRKMDFTYAQCESAVADETQSGSEFLSHHWTLIKDREKLVLIDMGLLNPDENITVEGQDEVYDLQFGSFDFKILDQITEEDLSNPFIAFVDAEKTVFPIRISRVHGGDRFHPLGMKGSKLVSDFFTDSKTPLTEKLTSYVLRSSDEIIWLVPHRIDDRNKLTEGTNKILRIIFSPIE
ncbi:MAG: tRNA lysidine(34) synthetase TilS [Bacteroidota bacterium]|jgi:tRNA(Ile)-lysidine synthase